jgi:hypothetical protein
LRNPGTGQQQPPSFLGNPRGVPHFARAQPRATIPLWMHRITRNGTMFQSGRFFPDFLEIPSYCDLGRASTKPRPEVLGDPTGALARTRAASWRHERQETIQNVSSIKSLFPLGLTVGPERKSPDQMGVVGASRWSRWDSRLRAVRYSYTETIRKESKNPT